MRLRPLLHVCRRSSISADARPVHPSCAPRSGYSPLSQPSPIDPRRTRVSFLPTDGSPELLLLEKGEPVEFSEERASKILQAEDLEVVVDLGGEGGGEAKYWTCDFSHVSRDARSSFFGPEWR